MTSPANCNSNSETYGETYGEGELSTIFRWVARCTTDTAKWRLLMRIHILLTLCSAFSPRGSLLIRQVDLVFEDTQFVCDILMSSCLSHTAHRSSNRRINFGANTETYRDGELTSVRVACCFFSIVHLSHLCPKDYQSNSN